MIIQLYTSIYNQYSLKLIKKIIHLQYIYLLYYLFTYPIVHLFDKYRNPKDRNMISLYLNIIYIYILNINIIFMIFY